jgi:molybdate transport system ATP-binding protein
MTLTVDVAHRRGEFTLEVRFEADRGVTALFGPSGAGKTTVLDLVAGLEKPTRGRIAIDGEVLVDTASGTCIPAHRRRIGYVFQDSRLFPHLSVGQNLDYGARFAGRRGPAPDRWHVVELLGLEGLLERRPATLSGGEKQRVAIGRALLSAPRLLLLDEPMASLDAARRAEILPYLSRVRAEAGIPIVHVSHALPEVAKLADTVVLMEAGRVTAVGPVAELLSRLDLGEASQAAKAGAVLTAVVAGPARRGQSPAGTVPVADPSSQVTVLRHPAGEFRVPWRGQSPGTTVRLYVMARDVALTIGEPGMLSIRNRLATTIVEIGPAHGGVREIRLDAGGEALLARVTAETVEEMGLHPGQAVTALIKSVALER